MAQTLLAKHARSIADPLMGKLGFDPVSIITLLLPLLMRLPCFQREQQTPAQFAKSHYDPNTDSFAPAVMDRMRPKAKKAAKQDGRKKLTDAELDTISDGTLRKAMNESDKVAANLLAYINANCPAE